METQDFIPLVERLEALTSELAQVDRGGRAGADLWDEIAPIARDLLATTIARLDAFEKRGYFAFAAELVNVGKRVVEGFSPDDVRQLGDAVVGILATVRELTRPEVLQSASDAAQAVSGDHFKPLGMFGAMRATRDDDVQRGLGLLIEVLRRVGRGLPSVGAGDGDGDREVDRRAKLAELIAPRRSRAPGGAAPRALPAHTSPAHAAPVRPAAACDQAEAGADRAPEPQVVDLSAWSRPVGEAIAKELGVTLGDAHWALIEAARADFAARHASPNIRRLTQVAQVTTKDLYMLFPKAPARTIAKIAGLPKPAGCL